MWIPHIGKIEHNQKGVSASCDYFPVAWGITNVFWYIVISSHIQFFI